MDNIVGEMLAHLDKGRDHLLLVELGPSENLDVKDRDFQHRSLVSVLCCWRACGTFCRINDDITSIIYTLSIAMLYIHNLAIKFMSFLSV